VLPQPSDPNPTRPTIRTIRAARIAPTAGATFVALSAGQLATLAVLADNTLRRTTGDVWTEGESNIVVEYEHGLDAPPRDLVRMALRRFRHWCNVNKTGIPDRAFAYTTSEGASYQLARAGAYTTGIADVDAAYSRYSLRPTTSAGPGDTGGGVQRPASRALNYDPQHSSLFHGGVR
jgi:hypothetical protein